MSAEAVIFIILLLAITVAIWNANRVPGKLKTINPKKIKKVSAYEVGGLLYRDRALARIAQKEKEIREIIEEYGYNKKEEDTIYEFISEAGPVLLSILSKYDSEEF